MPPPRDTLWELEPHSKGKHTILRRYVQAWLPILASNNSRLVLVDAFAGPGRYLGGEPGSPLILLDSYLSHAHRAQMNVEVVYLFIEERHDRVEHLRTEVAKLDLPENVQVEIAEGRYEALFRKELDDLQQAGKQIAPTLAFVDPFGYSDSPMDLTGQFLQFRRCEVLIYMPLSWVARFVSREGQDRAMTSLFGTDEWRRAVNLDGDERRRFLHDLFRDQVRDAGSRYVRSFEIHAGQGNGYTLFFGTNHELGLERMKEAMWKADPIAGQSFSDSTNTDQLTFIEPEVDTSRLLNDLHARFGNNPFTIEEAERFTLLSTPHVPTHLRRRTLAPEERGGRLEVLTRRDRKGTYPSRTVMRFLP
jgi:three-Cys-motif partner protein